MKKERSQIDKDLDQRAKELKDGTTRSFLTWRGLGRDDNPNPQAQHICANHLNKAWVLKWDQEAAEAHCPDYPFHLM